MDTFFFDADCGFCQWAARQLQAVTAESVGVGAGDALAIVPARVSTAPEQVARHIDRFAVYARSNTGRDPVEIAGLGHRAIGLALREHGRCAFWRIAGRVLTWPIISPVLAGVYRLVAQNRHRLGPLVGEHACAVPSGRAEVKSRSRGR